MIKNILKIIRPVNLLIMALTMLFLRYFYFKTNLDVFGVELLAKDWQYCFLVLSVLTSAAAGYVINDLFDIEADLINKPDKVIVEKTISKRQTLMIYTVLVLISVGFAGASIHSNILPLIVTVFFNFMLFLYSFKLKSMTFIGNVAISGIIAFVPAYALLYDVPTTLFRIDESTYEHFSKSILEEKFNGFIFFFMEMAFFINLSRELIKDILDIEGDKMLNIKTIPIVFGSRRTGIFAAVLLVVMGGLLIYHPVFNESPWSWYYFIGGVISSLAVACVLLLKQKYKQASLSLKIAMFIALMYLPVFHFAFGHHDA